MHETPDDIARLQSLLDRSYEAAGGHLREIITPDRRLTAAQLTERLQGMCLLVLATVTDDGRPINGPVDGIFYRGHWYFGSSRDSVRFRHIGARPWVSATHVPEEAFSVSTHGRADVIDVGAANQAGFRETLEDIYGAGFLAFVEESDSRYARIDAERMFTFFMRPSGR